MRKGKKKLKMPVKAYVAKILTISISHTTHSFTCFIRNTILL